MLREIELACARFSHMFLDREQRVVCLELPCSKTDPTAIGCSRSWGCICTGKVEEEDDPCPYCTAVFHEDRLRLQFGKGAKEVMPADLPLFPTIEGRTVYKEAVVKTIEAMAQQLGEPLADPWGRRRYGGHSMRVSGAKWLAAIGVEVPKIQTLARWSSDVVLRYLGEAHIGAIAGDVRRARTARKAVDGVDYSSFDKELANADTVNVQEVIREFKQEFQDSIAAVEERVAAQIGSLPSPAQAAPELNTVINEKNGVAHVIDGSLAASAATWRARCGWSFGRTRHFRFVGKDSLPSDAHWCKKCRDFQDDDWF